MQCRSLSHGVAHGRQCHLLRKVKVTRSTLPNRVVSKRQFRDVWSCHVPLERIRLLLTRRSESDASRCFIAESKAKAVHPQLTYPGQIARPCGGPARYPQEKCKKRVHSCDRGAVDTINNGNFRFRIRLLVVTCALRGCDVTT